MPVLISKDGTRIAYDKVGKGPAVILINGALGYRALNGEKNLASMLAEQFTVIYYDRRGRGETTETKPYSVAGEIEDVEALVDEAGGEAFLYGASSGAALALLSADNLGRGKVKKLALYEPPYGAYIREGKNNFAEIKKSVQYLVSEGKPGEAITLFFESFGTPSDVVQEMRQSPDWKQMEGVGHTLVYDYEILGDGTVPEAIAKKIAIPALILHGEKSFSFMHATAETLRKTIPGAQHKTLKDQTHQVSDDVIFKVLSDFFAKQ